MAFVVFSMFAILVVGAGAQARLVYSLARANMLPFSGTLRKINARSQTPIVALLVFAVIDVGVMIYGYNQPSAFGTLVGATAIIPYIIYFLITVAYAIKRRTTGSLPGAFNLGRWAWPVIGFVLADTSSKHATRAGLVSSSPWRFVPTGPLANVLARRAPVQLK